MGQGGVGGEGGGKNHPLRHSMSSHDAHAIQLLSLLLVKKRSFIWDYFSVDPKDDKKAVCGTCGESISRGGTNAKNFNTSNLQYHLQRVHIVKFEELELKQEEAEKKAEEYEVKRRKTDARQLTLTEVKEHKDL